MNFKKIVQYSIKFSPYVLIQKHGRGTVDGEISTWETKQPTTFLHR